MMVIQPTRRQLLAGIGLALAAPVIVRAASIMPVRSIEPDGPDLRIEWMKMPTWNGGSQVICAGYSFRVSNSTKRIYVARVAHAVETMIPPEAVMRAAGWSV